MAVPLLQGAGTHDGSHIPCDPVVDGVRFDCPAGWFIVDRDHSRPGAVTLGNYSPNPDKNLSTMTPAGTSTISIEPKPDLYRDLDVWIDAAHGNKCEGDSGHVPEQKQRRGSGALLCFRSRAQEAGRKGVPVYNLRQAFAD